MKKYIPFAALLLSLGMVQVTSAETKVFRFAHAGDVETLDPHGTSGTESSQFQSNIYEALTYFVPGGEVQPSLATSWEKTAPTTWRFELRQGVKFHNGEDFTADDVIFSFKRAADERSRVRYAVKGIKDIRKIDAHTIEMDLVSENSGITRELNTFFIMSQKWAEEHGLESAGDAVTNVEAHTVRHANGTGPFKLKSRNPGTSITLEPNPDWWGTPTHNLSEVRFTPIASDSTRVAALLSGQVDFISPVPIQSVGQLQAASGVKVMETVGTRTLFLMMDLKNDELLESNVTGKNPFKQIEVRKAIASAIDRKSIVDKVMMKNATPANLVVAPDILGFDEALAEEIPYDPELAKQLLSDAGYEDGFRVTLTCPNDEYPNDAEICQSIVPMLARIGIDVNLETMNYTRAYDKILSGNASFYMFGWSGSQTMEATSILSNVFHTPGPILGSYNVVGFSDERIDQIYAKALKEDDQEARKRIMAEGIQILRDSAVAVPLMYLHVVWAMNDKVDATQGSDNFLHLKDVTLN